MKLPKPKYAVSITDRLHFLLQTALGFIIGTVLYSLSYAIVQAIENHRYMNSSAKEYVVCTGVKILIVILNIVFVHIFPIVFQAVFIRHKPGDQYEVSDNKLMWLSKVLLFMLPVALPYAIITAVGTFVFMIEPCGYLFMPAINFMQVLDMMFGHFLTTSSKMPVLTIILCYIIYMAIHVAALLFVYRYFWFKWENEKDIGRVTMSADAYMVHHEADQTR